MFSEPPSFQDTASNPTPPDPEHLHPEPPEPFSLSSEPSSPEGEETYSGGGKTYKGGPGCFLGPDQSEIAPGLCHTFKIQKNGDSTIVAIHKKHTNLLAILRQDPEYGPELKMSEMGQRIYHHGKEVDTDTFVSLVRDYITRNYLGVDFSQESTKTGIHVVASESTFHPVRDMLEQLPAWDGQPRLERVPVGILHTEDLPLYGTYFKKTLISMVARVMEPGCDVHTILVLAGPQGTLKSTFMKFLAIDPAWFTCSKLDIKDKDGRLNLHFVWITELAEIDRLINRVGDDSLMKEFITDPCDLFRAPYAPAPKMHRRSGVMVGTTNEPEFLRDKTGSRRYWPMTIHGKIDIEKLREVREQLWAEAFYRYNQGEQWWLTDEEDALRAEQARGYEVEDPLEDFLRDALKDLAYQESGASIAEMIERLPLEYRRVQSNRLSNILRRFGWEKRKITNDGRKTNRWMAPEGWTLGSTPATGSTQGNPIWPELNSMRGAR